MTRGQVQTDHAPAPAGAYSAAVRVGPFLQTSGQLGLGADPAVATDVATQTRASLGDVEALLRAAGASWADVLSVRVFLADDSDFDAFDAFDACCAQVVPRPWPARTTVGAQLAPGALVEIDALAVLPERTS